MRKKTAKAKPPKQGGPTNRVGRAAAHQPLVDDFVHIFIDDQNLFYGVRNTSNDYGYRIDFGQLLLAVCKDGSGRTRGIKSAYIAGVIPDDHTFWQVARDRGLTVRRGYLGTGNRSKPDDAYLIADMVETLYTQPGPSTIVLVAGDADYVPPLLKALDRGWRNEIAFIDRGISISLEPVVHEFRTLTSGSIQLMHRR